MRDELSNQLRLCNTILHTHSRHVQLHDINHIRDYLTFISTHCNTRFAMRVLLEAFYYIHENIECNAHIYGIPHPETKYMKGNIYKTYTFDIMYFIFIAHICEYKYPNEI
jgi:hypothetical protein